MIVRATLSRKVARTFLVSTALASASTSLAQTAQAQVQPAPDPTEIIVTAQKRSESLQRVPMNIQALTTQKLEQLQVRNFADYVTYLPSTSYTTGTTGTPGNASASFRGVATDGGLVLSGTLPTVGIYLDEQPVTTIQGAADVHIYDIARVEALAGPQGTLYGASSEAGTIRIITNKPDPHKTSGSFDVDVNKVSHGDYGGQMEGYFNLPIVKDKIALRTVGWYRHDGGYIDNVFRARRFPTSGIVQTNGATVEKDTNDVDVYGLRAQLGIDLNDSWTVTPSVNYNKSTWQGSFMSDDTKVGELKTAHYFPEYGRDEFVQAGGTITGKLANLDVTYAGYYMDRRRADQNDYSDYGFFYDLVSGSGSYVKNNTGQLIDPSQVNRNHAHLTKHSQELRLATPSAGRVRAVAGLFYQRQTQLEENDYLIPGLANSLSIPGRPGQAWLTLENRVDRDYAIFGQADFDVTDKLTLTGGARAYRFNNSLVGFFGVNGRPFYGPSTADCLGRASGAGPYGRGLAVVPGTPCTDLGVLNADGSISPKVSKGSGYTWRANATYKFTPDNLVWVTASTGFRPGGINRAGTAQPFDADKLYNYELGTKNSFLDRRLTLNADIFQEDWKNVQVSYQVPGGSGVSRISNVGKARIRGIEGDFSYRSPVGLTISGAAAYTDAKLLTPFNPFARAVPDAPIGTRLPLTPKFKGNLIGRYEWTMANANKAHFQLAGAYIGKRTPVLNVAGAAKTGVLPAYFTLEASTGLAFGNSTIELYARNLTDARGQQSRAARCNINICGPSSSDPIGEVYRIYIQPRTVGIRFGQKL